MAPNAAAPNAPQPAASADALGAVLSPTLLARHLAALNLINTARQSEINALGTAASRVRALAVSLRALSSMQLPRDTVSPDGSNATGARDDSTRQRADSSRKVLEQLGAGIEGAFQRGKAALLQMTAVGDAGLFSTLTNSVDMLTIRLQSMFGPSVEYVAAQLQSVGRWMDNLSESTRGVVARVGVAALVFGGLVVAARTVTAAIGAARAAMTAFSVAAMANPVGALLRVATVIGGIAAAWIAAGQAARGAKGAFEDASNIQAGLNPEAGAGDKMLNRAEAELTPARYRDQFRTLDRLREAILQNRDLDDTERQTALAENERQRKAVTKRYLGDVDAQRQSLPQSVQDEMKAKPEQAGDILNKFKAGAEEQIKRQRETLIPRIEDEKKELPKRQQWLEEAARSPEVLKVFREQRDALRKKFNDPEFTLRADAGDFDSLMAMRAVRAEMLRKADDLSGGRADYTPAEVEKIRFEFAGPVVKALEPRNIPGQTETRINELQAGINLANEFQRRVGAGAAGGNDPAFLRDMKLPVQSRYVDSDFGSIQANAQLKALEVGDAEAEKMRLQLENVAKALGENVGAIRDFIRATREATLSGRTGGAAAWFTGD